MKDIVKMATAMVLASTILKELREAKKKKPTSNIPKPENVDVSIG